MLYIARPSAVTHTRHCLKRPSSYLCRIARPSAVTQSGTGDVRMYVARPTHPHTIFATGTKNPFTENTFFRISAVKSIAPRHGSLFCSFKKRSISQTNKSNTKPFFFFYHQIRPAVGTSQKTTRGLRLKNSTQTPSDQK